MHLKKLYYLVILLILMPTYAVADIDCFEERPHGYPIPRDHKLPKEWWFIGDKAISDPKLHSELSSKYKEYYVINEEGSGFICFYAEGVYITISDGESGPWFEFSTIPPKECRKCNPVKIDLKKLSPKSGLKIGQTEAQVSSLLGVSIPREDIVEIFFREIEKSEKGNIWHNELLRLEFKGGKLSRFSVHDHREPTGLRN